MNRIVSIFSVFLFVLVLACGSSEEQDIARMQEINRRLRSEMRRDMEALSSGNLERVKERNEQNKSDYKETLKVHDKNGKEYVIEVHDKDVAEYEKLQEKYYQKHHTRYEVPEE